MEPQSTSSTGTDWLDQDRAEQNGAAGLARPARVILVALGFAAAALGAIAVVTQERAAVVDPIPTATPVAVREPDSDSIEDPHVREQLAVALRTLPDLTLILAQSGAVEPVRITTGQQTSIEQSAFVEQHSFALDRSGAWLAALSGHPDTGGATLWIGPVDGELRLAATDVRGFAWHDSIAGRLAFGAASSVLRIDASDPDFETRELFESSLHVMHWGAWGLVGRPSASTLAFHILDPAGNEIATEYRGTVVGAVNSRQLVFNPVGSRAPLMVDPSSGLAWPISTLADAQLVRSVAPGGYRGAVAVLVSNFDTDTFEVRIFPGFGQPVRNVATVEDTGALRWSHDGSSLYFLRRSTTGGSEVITYSMETELLVATPLQGMSQTDHWSSAISDRGPSD